MWGKPNRRAGSDLFWKISIIKLHFWGDLHSFLCDGSDSSDGSVSSDIIYSSDKKIFLHKTKKKKNIFSLYQNKIYKKYET